MIHWMIADRQIADTHLQPRASGGRFISRSVEVFHKLQRSSSRYETVVMARVIDQAKR